MSKPLTLLAIDDAPNNLRALKIDLEDDNYEVLTANDGIQGWDLLLAQKDNIKVILLDRMMPNMDGMAFMHKLKHNEEVSHIPVIMQTAAAEKEQIVEGIKAGVYYYLTKPYDKELMLSVVRAAIHDYIHYSQMRDELHQFKSKLRIVKSCHFEIQTIEDTQYLATMLANFFPQPERVIFGISEILVNAIEHGNLSISYDEKTELKKRGSWQQEVERRLQLPEYRNKRALVHYKKTDTEITLTVIDQGQGFDWESYMELEPERATHNHGRGIAMARKISFDHIEYTGKGNEVICTVKLPEESQEVRETA